MVDCFNEKRHVSWKGAMGFKQEFDCKKWNWNGNGHWKLETWNRHESMWLHALDTRNRKMHTLRWSKGNIGSNERQFFLSSKRRAIDLIVIKLMCKNGNWISANFHIIVCVRLVTVDAVHESDIGRNPLPSRSPEKTCKKDDFLFGGRWWTLEMLSGHTTKEVVDVFL